MKKALLPGRFLSFIALLTMGVCMSVALAGLFGCGKKAPPLPPHSEPVPPVTDLSYALRDSRVMLTWTVPKEVKQGSFGEGEMILSRARTKLVDELCPECPLVFQTIAVLPIFRADGEPKPTYEEEVAKGFRFTYKVVFHMSSGRSSGPSNLVTFDY